MTISLSQASQRLVLDLRQINNNLVQELSNDTIDKAELIAWFEKSRQIASNDRTFLLISSLQTSLLKDLNRSLMPLPANKEQAKKSAWSRKATYWGLAVAGTIYFGCEGFDGITAILGIFTSVPAVAVFAAGALFSILSIIVFYSFELVEISKNLGVKSSDAPKLLDVLVDEFKEIKKIRSKLSSSKDKTKQELIEDLNLAKMLKQRHEHLNEAREKFRLALDNPYLKIGKMVTAGIAGILFFSGGFFAGQTVALALSSLIVATLTVTAWPIIAVSLAVGLAALSVYWFVERPGIENLISRWRGLDKKKIDTLCQSEAVDRETGKLDNLIKDLEQIISMQEDLNQKEERIRVLSSQPDNLQGNGMEQQAEHQGAAKNDDPINLENSNGMNRPVKGITRSEEGNPNPSHKGYSSFFESRRSRSCDDIQALTYTSYN